MEEGEGRSENLSLILSVQSEVLLHCSACSVAISNSMGTHSTVIELLLSVPSRTMTTTVPLDCGHFMEWNMEQLCMSSLQCLISTNSHQIEFDKPYIMVPLLLGT